MWMITLFLRDVDVAARFGVKRITIWHWVKNNQFPPPVKLSRGCTRWRLDDIEKWERERITT